MGAGQRSILQLEGLGKVAMFRGQLLSSIPTNSLLFRETLVCQMWSEVWKTKRQIICVSITGSGRAGVGLSVWIAQAEHSPASRTGELSGQNI